MRAMSVVFASACVLFLGVSVSTSRAQDWVPERNVELIVPAGAGGSLDTTGRLVQRLWTELKLVPQPSAVVNRGGGGHALAYAYLGQHEADPHILSITSPTILTNHINGRLPHTYRAFTPLGILLTEYIAFAVPADSPVKTGRDLMNALRDSPEKYSVALSSALGGTHHLSLGIPAKSAGVDMKHVKLVAFNSSSDAITAILGGHVNVISTSTAVLLPHLKSGKLRAIAVSSPKRMTGEFAHTPTWTELGLKGTWENWRGVIAAGNITPAQMAYWEGVLKKVTESETFKSYAEKYQWDTSFSGATQMASFLGDQYAELHDVMAFLGFAKPVMASSDAKGERKETAR
jgi:putative tricarboxylic transport membrane protein